MKKRIAKKILSTLLAASMILGNIGLPQGLEKVHAAQTDIDSIISGKTLVSDSEIKNLYREMSYAPQAVHDPSIIKAGDEWYVFGSHRAVAKTGDLQNWETVNIDGLFGDGNGNILTPDNAFVHSLYNGTIQTGGTAQVFIHPDKNSRTADISDEPEDTGTNESEEAGTDEPEDARTDQSAAESEETPVSESESESEQPSETVPETEPVSESEADVETEKASEAAADAEPEKFLYGEAKAAHGETTEEASGDNAAADIEAVSESETATSEENLSVETPAESEEVPADDNETEAELETSSEAEAPSIEDPSETQSETETETEEAETEETTVIELESEQEGHKKITVYKQAETTQTEGAVTFGSFDANAWCTASDGWNILEGTNSNMWAPDIIYNPSMQKYCMYLSLNGKYQNSVVILLTSDRIEGPYAYQGPVVYSGFSAQENTPINYKNTDLKYIIGENAELPERYKKISGATINESGKITDITENKWADFWPHAIDPAVFYDDNDNLWMIYGSWSGGIYALELDETTGLRDYTVSYGSDYDDKKQGVTCDPYFGRKIAGGYYVSGEGPYIEKIGNYYYLFMSYGFYAPNGGYSMRIFRSENPDGPYVDTKGTSAVFDEFHPNFIADYAQDVKQIDTRGMRLMTYYQWDHMSKGEVAQGHNSAIADNGRAYVIYHTKFNDGTASHELRVHELFQNKNGWILASPFAFANDEKLDYDAEPTGVAGEYEIIVGDYSRGYDANSGALHENYTGPLSEIVTYVLTPDGKITKDGQDTGTWALENGKAYATLTINNHAYSGVFAEVTKDSAGIKTMCFTGVDEQTGITLWGAKKLGGKAVIADNVVNPTYTVPEKVYGSFELPSEGSEGVHLYWKSADKSLVTDDGTISELPENDTDVTFTMTMVSGDYYYQKEYTIKIASKNSLTDGKYLVGEAYTDNALTLPDQSKPSMKNPFYKTNTTGLELSGGVSIAFDVKHNGTVDALGALFAFNGNQSGKLYFTQGSYLGYNALGGYYDANLNNYNLVKDYIGDAIAESGKETAHVTINLTAAGFEVLVDDKLAYDQTILDTPNGAGDLQDFTNVLTWLQSSAPTLCMGYGAWWDDRLAKAVISNMKFYVNLSDDETTVDSVIAALEKQIPASTMKDITLPTAGSFGAAIQWTSSHPDIIAADGKVTQPDKETEVTLTATVTKGSVTKTAAFKVIVKLPATANVVLKKELLEITDAAQIELIDNPFYGKNLDTLVVDYDITFTEGGYKTGYDGIFAFYNSGTTGRVSFQTNPYICLNEMLLEPNVFLDINHPEKNNLAKDMKFGQEYNVKIIIKKTACRIYLDGALVVDADENTLSGNADFTELLDYVGKCDKFSWGVGNQTASFWGSELSTVKNISISSNEYKSDCQEKVELATAPTVMDNPLYGKKLEEVVLDFNVNFAENAAMNGWDGLLAFYQPSEGAAGGRVSIQTAPYICYNETESADNKWLDINNPNDLNSANIEIPVTKLDRAQTHHYYIRISAFEVVMEIDGEKVEWVKSGAASYRDMLDFISVCQKFSWGVTMNENCFWGMEKCTLKDASVRGYYSKEYTDVEEDNKKVTVTLHYPDGTTATEMLKKNTRLTKPAYTGEDENGTYQIDWYTDEAKTALYDFDTIVSENMDLYGSKNYNPSEDDNQVTVTLHYPDGTITTKTLDKNTKLTKPEFEGVDENGTYQIDWYADEAKTVLYDFDTIVSDDIALYGSKNYNQGGNDNKVTATLHYPDGTVEVKILEKNSKLEKPVFEEEDANGKYGIIWYANEEKTTLYHFDDVVSEDIALYGSYYYYCEEPGKDENGTTTPTKTGIWVERINDQQYTGTAIKPAVTVYDGTKKLKEQVDYKVSYSDNKKVSTKDKPAKVLITPCGNYEKASKFSIDFNIRQRQLTKENVTINYKPEINVKYNKQKAVVGQIQKISLKYGKMTIPAKEYTITYKKGDETVENLTEAGTYQIVINTKDSSSFAGALSYDIVVTDKILTSALKFKAAAQNYSGEPLTTTIDVTHKGKSVVPDGQQLSDIFAIEYSNNTNAGTASVTLTAKADSNYYGSKTINFIINGTAINKAAIDGFQSSIPYTGEAVIQDVKLILNKGKAEEKILQLGTDYDIAYTDNENAGKAAMTITGKGAFSGTVKKTFTIGKINLKQAAGDVTAAFAETTQPLKVTQDKSGAKPAVTVTYKETILEPDKDYKVIYSGNKAAGVNGKVTIKGIGNYTGDLKNVLAFEITPKDISDTSIMVIAEDLKFAANGRYKAKLTVYDNGVKLTSGEYTVGAIENITMFKNEAGEDTQCGTAEALLTGKKNYTETRSVTIQIKKTLVSSAKIKVNGTYYYANENPICPTPDKLEVTIGSGNNKVTLTPGEDFIIESFNNNTRKGNATITIRGIGEYGGSKSVKFKILPKWMKRTL
ncbi:MAG: hypothetical protein K2N73_07635 [Lachnospiraceae bacterium]|nr:hypothetical protein [Lachnospiraceae bacterium]